MYGAGETLFVTFCNDKLYLHDTFDFPIFQLQIVNGVSSTRLIHRERNKYLCPLSPHLGVQILYLLDLFIYSFYFQPQIKNFCHSRTNSPCSNIYYFFSESNTYALKIGGVKMTNVFCRYTSVIYAVSHCPPFHLKTVTYTRLRNVANSQHYTSDKRNKSSAQQITMSVCLPFSLLTIL